MTDFNPWAILTIGLIGLGIGIAWTVLSFPLAVLVGRMFARGEGEVVRDDEGWDWLYNQADALPADAIWFGAEVLADLDELPEWSS